MGRRKGRIDEVVQAWYNHDDFPCENHTGSVYFDDHKTIYSYGTQFPLAVRSRDCMHILRNIDKYSVTTSCHQGQFRHILRNQGHFRNDGVPVSFYCLKSMDIDYREIKVLDLIKSDYSSDYSINDRVELAEKVDQARREYGHFATVTAGQNTQWDGTLLKHIPAGGFYMHVNVKPHALLEYDKRYFIAGSGKAYWLRWVCELPYPVSSIRKGLAMLKPDIVSQAEEQNLDVRRIGKYFFIPRYHGKEAKWWYKHMLREFPYHKAVSGEEVEARKHRVWDPWKHCMVEAEQYGAPFASPGGWPWATRGCIHDGKVYVSGQVHASETHRKHCNLSYATHPIIYEVVKNTALQSVSTLLYEGAKLS